MIYFKDRSANFLYKQDIETALRFYNLVGIHIKNHKLKQTRQVNLNYKSYLLEDDH